MTTPIQASVHLANVYNRLIETYGKPDWKPDYDPLGGLIGTILSQHTSDINSDRAYRSLIQRYPTWEQVRDAPTTKVADTIRSGGLANVKAVRIQDVLYTLTEQQAATGGHKSLAEFLYDEITGRSAEEAWTYLRSLPGVGPKTAACVMLFDMGAPIMPVDTHVHRVSKRLGLIGARVNADQAHLIFARIAPAEWVDALHINLIKHGRTICHAQRPECGRCPLYEECVHVGSINPQKTSIS